MNIMDDLILRGNRVANLRRAELENLKRLVDLIPTSNSEPVLGSPEIHRETRKTPREKENGIGDIGDISNPVSQAPDSLDQCQSMVPAEDPLGPASLGLSWYDEFQGLGLASEHISSVVNQLSADGFPMEENRPVTHDNPWFWGPT